jgi:hypothetical protein
MKKAITLAAALALAAASAGALDPRIDIVQAIAWDKLDFTATTRLNLASAGLRLPTGRSQAEELADMEFPRLVRSSVFGLPVDSASTVADLVDRGTVSLAETAALVAGAERSASALSPDLTELATSYRIDLRGLIAGLVRHSRPATPPRPLDALPGRDYTGIIVYANETLPLRGTRQSALAGACFFPKIWDSEMGLVYDKNMVDPAVARERGIVRYASATDDPSYAERVGDRPLRILARGVFGLFATDPVIDRADALRILGTEANRALLREGKVIIVLAPEALTALPQ